MHAQIHVNITCFYLFRFQIETHFVNIWTYQIQFTFGESAVHRTKNDSLKTKVSLGNQKKTSNEINVIEHGELLPFLTQDGLYLFCDTFPNFNSSIVQKLFWKTYGLQKSTLMLLSSKQIQIFKEISLVADNLPSTLKSLYLSLYEKVVHTSNMI